MPSPNATLSQLKTPSFAQSRRRAGSGSPQLLGPHRPSAPFPAATPRRWRPGYLRSTHLLIERSHLTPPTAPPSYRRLIAPGTKRRRTVSVWTARPLACLGEPPFYVRHCSGSCSDVSGSARCRLRGPAGFSRASAGGPITFATSTPTSVARTTRGQRNLPARSGVAFNRGLYRHQRSACSDLRAADAAFAGGPSAPAATDKETLDSR